MDVTVTENTRKMEVFLTSTEKASDFVNTLTEIPAGTSRGQQVVETCLEVRYP